MTGFLLDTDVVSELFRREPDAGVQRWWVGTTAQSFVSVLVLGELRRGVERLAPRDPQRAADLHERVEGITRDYLDRTLPVTAEIAEVWGRMSARRALPPIDGLLAATAAVHGLTLATRNVHDIAGLDIPFVNPFSS